MIIHLFPPFPSKKKILACLASNGVVPVSLSGHHHDRRCRRASQLATFHRDPSTGDAARCYSGRPLRHTPVRIPSPSPRSLAAPTARFPTAISATDSGHSATTACDYCVSTTHPISHNAAALAISSNAGTTYACCPSKAVAFAVPCSCVAAAASIPD
ncbi:hypothetical protein GUJ93_ZPchr0001g32590 [Zizania palustris]|uniref:Uncharacterized protein n=1 Tax=Zizania palustris TaxID=103762 RepID=A0A8J5RSV2_ZIZPA|nr:hypothetical protein GUJ93_ZPchr0001g32590 [Zizania palustris]